MPVCVTNRGGVFVAEKRTHCDKTCLGHINNENEIGYVKLVGGKAVVCPQLKSKWLKEQIKGAIPE